MLSLQRNIFRKKIHPLFCSATLVVFPFNFAKTLQSSRLFFLSKLTQLMMYIFTFRHLLEYVFISLSINSICSFPYCFFRISNIK